MAEQKETKNPVQSAERIFQVMEMLADHGEMGLMEISTALGLHKSTVHRLLMSLVYMGYAKQDEVSQKYMLSYKIVSMAGKCLTAWIFYRLQNLIWSVCLISAGKQCI